MWESWFNSYIWSSLNQGRCVFPFPGSRQRVLHVWQLFILFSLLQTSASFISIFQLSATVFSCRNSPRMPCICVWQRSSCHTQWLARSLAVSTSRTYGCQIPHGRHQAQSVASKTSPWVFLAVLVKAYTVTWKNTSWYRMIVTELTQLWPVCMWSLIFQQARLNLPEAAE